MSDFSTELNQMELALRRAIVYTFPDGSWLEQRGAPNKEKLVAKMHEEERRRDGAIPFGDLIHFAEFHDVVNIILKNWEYFKEIFDDQARTKVYLNIAQDVRNALAHSREILSFEENLLLGASGQMRNQVALYASKRADKARNYPIIESMTDSFGRVAEGDMDVICEQSAIRLEVGDQVVIKGTAALARGKNIKWFVGFSSSHSSLVDKWIFAGHGEEIEFEHQFSDDQVSEYGTLHVRIVSESLHHRHGKSSADSLHREVLNLHRSKDEKIPDYFARGYDDEKCFYFSINPPFDA